MKLKELQEELARVVMNPLDPRQKMQRAIAGREDAFGIAERHIVPSQRMTSVERLQVYNRQYWFRLIDCLSDDYPGLSSLIGEQAFYKLAVAYLTKFPSTSFTLRNLGKHLIQFLIDEPQWLGRRKRIGLQMAMFEWAQIVAFDGPAHPPLTPSAEVEIFSGLSTLVLQPYLTFLKVDYPLDLMIGALKKNEKDRSEGISAQGRVKERRDRFKIPPREAVYLAIHRYKNELYYKRLEPAAYHLLTAIQEGATLNDGCQKAARVLKRSGRADDEISSILEGWFALWASLGWFCTIPSAPS